MAAKKKRRPKAKTKKRKSVKKTAPRRKTTKKKVAARRVAAKKKVAKKARRKKKVAPKKRATPARRAAAPAKPAPAPAAAAIAPVGEERVGVVTHYYTHLQVAVVRMESGMLREGDMIHIKGHTSDFRQRASSMEIDHVHMPEVRAGQEFGLRVIEHAREHDVVYKVPRM